MQLPQDAMLLRIFIGEGDRWHHQPLYEALVLKARELHLAGATGNTDSANAKDYVIGGNPIILISPSP